MTQPAYPRVLLVEDDETLGRVIAKNLAARGVTVRIATTAAEALSSCKAGRPDLLLLDIGLPDRSGWDVLRELRARGEAIPVVVMTVGQVRPERIQEFHPLCAFPKPFPLDALLRIVVGGEPVA